jgi:hypothetical protein
MLGAAGDSYDETAATCRRQFPDVTEIRERAALPQGFHFTETEPRVSTMPRTGPSDDRHSSRRRTYPKPTGRFSSRSFSCPSLRRRTPICARLRARLFFTYSSRSLRAEMAAPHAKHVGWDL